MIYMARLVLFLFVAVECSGCTPHPISISPNLTSLNYKNDQSRIAKSVAYYIPEETRRLKVITAGGGGDSVSYTPYKDLETGIYQALSNVFSRVYVTTDTTERDFLRSDPAIKEWTLG